jgi:DNA primase
MYSSAEKIQFLVKAFGTSIMGGDRKNIAVSCPACSGNNKNKKKLAIRVDNDHYQCWVCGIKGRNLLGLLKKYAPKHLNEYQEKFLDKKYKAKQHADQHVETKLEMPKGYTLLAESLSSLDPDVKEVIRYALSRGISHSDMWRFAMGTCRTGRFRRRLVIPSFDHEGALNYYVGRKIDEENSSIKYINAKVPKKDIIFNEIRILWNKPLTVVEGPLDLVKCDDNATCLLGSEIREGHALFNMIIKNQTPVILALDPDAIEKTHKFAKNLTSYGIDVSILDVGKHEDVGAMSKEQFLKAKAGSKPWTQESRLFHMISKIKSGSII